MAAWPYHKQTYYMVHFTKREYLRRSVKRITTQQKLRFGQVKQFSLRDETFNLAIPPSKYFFVSMEIHFLGVIIFSSF